MMTKVAEIIGSRYLLRCPSHSFGRRRSTADVELLDQIFGAQMGVPLQHLHRFVTRNGGDLLVAEAGFDQAGNRLMAQIVKAQAGDLVVY